MINNKYLIGIGLLVLLIGIATVSATDSIDVTTSDTFYFYSTDSLAADDGYYAAVVVDGTPYYLDDHESQDIKMGHVKVGSLVTPGTPVGDFEQPVDKEFSFDYKIGQVGLNKNAHIITNLDLDD